MSNNTDRKGFTVTVPMVDFDAMAAKIEEQAKVIEELKKRDLRKELDSDMDRLREANSIAISRNRHLEVLNYDLAIESRLIAEEKDIYKTRYNVLLSRGFWARVLNIC